MAWASENGYVNGVTATSFQPEGRITRQQAMAILYRYVGGTSGMELMFRGIYEGTFTDSAQIGAYAQEAEYWGIYNEILTPHMATTVDPTTLATRGEIAEFLVRYLDRMS